MQYEGEIIATVLEVLGRSGSRGAVTQCRVEIL